MDRGRNRRRAVELAKDVLIAALVCSALLLASRSQLLGKLGGADGDGRTDDEHGVADDIRDAVDDAGQAAEDAAKDAGDLARDAVDGTGRAIEKAGDALTGR